MTRLLNGIALAVTVGLALVAAAVAADSPTARESTLREIPGSVFPERTFLLTLPSSGKLNAQNVTVLENGQTVDDLQVSLPGAGALRAGAVFLLDASKSMEGDPILKATDAAQAFATRIPPRIELAVILFNNKTPIVLPLTSDPERIANVLARPPALAYGTRIDDAVAAASALLREAGVEAGSIVLLSDGADVGSRTDTATAIAAAKDAGARVYAVGLDSPQFDATTLSAYAKATGGSYVLARNPDDLAPILRGIGARISSQFVLNYKSFAGSGETVYVSVRTPGIRGVATTSYAAPGLPVAAVDTQSRWDRLIQSAWFAILVGAVVVGLIGWAVYVLVTLLDRRFETRLSRFVGMSDEESLRLRQEQAKRKASDASEEEESVIARMRWYKRLEDDVQVGRLGLTASQIVTLTVVASAVTAALAVVVTGFWWTALIGIAPVLVARSYVEWKMRTLRREFAEQLPETLDVVSSALRSGHSLIGALGVAVDGAPEPSHAELGRALADERLGVPLDEALRVTAQRMDNIDLKQVSLVAQLQREAGTNSAEVLDQVATNVRHQMELRRLIRSLTAQGRMSRWIVSLLPVGLFCALYLINPAYLSPLWETTGGILALITSGVMIVLGSYAIKRIVEIDV